MSLLALSLVVLYKTVAFAGKSFCDVRHIWGAAAELGLSLEGL
jgi:hypothetical protein